MKNCIICNKELISNQKKFCSFRCHNNFRKIRPVGYHGLHKRVYAKFGKAKVCLICNKTEGKIEWANKSGNYENNLTDWIQLCNSCHKFYDSSLRKGFILGKEYHCSKCKKNLPLDSFHKDSSRPSKVNSICKGCASLKGKIRRNNKKIYE